MTIITENKSEGGSTIEDITHQTSDTRHTF